MVKTFGKAFLGALLGLAIVGAVGTTAVPAVAQDVQYIATHRDWHAFQFMEGGNKACYVASKPTQLEPTNVNHGDIFVLVTHRPAENQRNVVSLMVGYNFRQGSEATVSVGDRTFALFTDGSTAWTRDPASDEALVAAMKAGSTMVVRATSARGTNVTYTFSLLGVTAALNEIDRACAG